MKYDYSELQKDIQDAYENGVTVEDAEKLSAKFLWAQMHLATAFRNADLDCRMRKAGLKTVKATVYLDEATKSDKKPTEATLTALIDKNPHVVSEQGGLDAAEVERDYFQNCLNTLKEAHIFFRNVGKGRYE